MSSAAAAPSELKCRYVDAPAHRCFPLEGLCKSEEMARSRDPRPQRALPVDVSDHVEDAAGRCEACGFEWPCPDIRRQPRQLEPGERELLSIVGVDVGSHISKIQPAGADPTDAHQGLVVESFRDDDDRLCHRVARAYRGYRQVRVIRDDEIEPASVGLPDRLLIRSTARQFAAFASRRKGVVDQDEIGELSDALILLLAIA